MKKVVPPLKWPGGKRWLVRDYAHLLSKNDQRFVEPFAGSAAVFFCLQPTTAWLNDVNRDLINVYHQLKHDWERIYLLLLEHQRDHSTGFYYEMRAYLPDDLADQAARFIYLNRTCFNGIYRVNLQGVFNVPIGTKSTVISDKDDFETISQLLKGAELSAYDFEQVIEQCGEGDFLFVDPPYTVKHNMNGFLKYNENLFAWSDQVRLRESLVKARIRGADVLVCNANHESIISLYDEIASEITVLSRHSVIAANAKTRRVTTEVMIRL